MKKNLFMVAAVALVAAVSCNKEGLGDNSQTPSSIVFTAGIDTKTVLVPDPDGDATVNHQIHWVSGDEIRVDGVTFKTTDSGAKANFTTESAFTADNDYYAIYPASAGTTLGFVTVPAAQEVEAGKFNPSAVVSVAKSTTTSLEFKNVTSLLKFQVPAPATTVTISSSSPLAGDVSVDYNEGEPTWTAVNTVNTITVTGSFETGKDYYVAVLPGEKKDFEVRVDGYLSKGVTFVTLDRSIVMNMKTLPAPVKSIYKIKGDFSGWGDVYLYDEGAYYVARNLAMTTGEFLFFDDNETYYKGGQDYTVNSWSYIWNTNGGNMKVKDIVSGKKYDVYFDKSLKRFNFIESGSQLPTTHRLYIEVKNNNWSKYHVYGWASFDKNSYNGIWGSWNNCPVDSGILVDGTRYMYIDFPDFYNGKTINFKLSNGSSSESSEITGVVLNSDIYCTLTNTTLAKK